MLNENGIEGFYQVLSDIAKAKKWVNISQEIGASRKSLYKSLSKIGNPNFKTILKALNSLSIDITFKPV